MDGPGMNVPRRHPETALKIGRARKDNINPIRCWSMRNSRMLPLVEERSVVQDDEHACTRAETGVP